MLFLNSFFLLFTVFYTLHINKLTHCQYNVNKEFLAVSFPRKVDTSIIRPVANYPLLAS